MWFICIDIGWARLPVAGLKDRLSRGAVPLVSRCDPNSGKHRLADKITGNMGDDSRTPYAASRRIGEQKQRVDR